ncbi:hypothetical protein E1211_09735 [Micromonospora sp. 15K316]|uniref:hypothetical protein n=1 Tax=Micromonospora sp. 15K316 TaxID=2530376 RepID=UPI001046D34E|nr:hypothetical protein [Micromonospora sp. 15K316]TDC37666.1 hypothetical protein E1211_09735 [Micromonospora sp. 15K316]
MDPAVARRFPLIARTRPVCTPLPKRIVDLQERADLAEVSGDVAAATAVFNLAALLASDCGMPDLARTWCHRLATLAIAHGSDPQHALEPIVNLARLHIRAGDGPTAWSLLETLFQAINTRTDIMIDGLTIPVARLTDTPGAHTKTRTWLWTVLLGAGAHALAIAGRWDEASHRLTQYNGIGARMLDGRQITIIAHATAGRHRQARAMFDATQPGEPWENGVTACLRLLTAGPDFMEEQAGRALTAYWALGPAKPGLTVFHTRLGFTLLDALGKNYPPAEQIAVELIQHAAGDGYVARDLLTHPTCLAAARHEQVDQLEALVSACGLDAGTLPAAHLKALLRTLDIAESVIARTPFV